MAGAMFHINGRDGASPYYYTHNPRFDHIRGSLLFQLPTKILNALQSLGLRMFVSRMVTDLVLTALEIY